MSTVTISLVLAVGIGSFSFLRGGLLQRGAQAQGATLLQGAGQGNGPLQNGSPPQGGEPSQGSGPLEGTGPLQGGGPFEGAGPLQGNMPILTGASIGVGGPIAGANGPPAPRTTLAGWPPDVRPATAIFGLGPVQLLSDPTPPFDPSRSQQPQTACVTCFIPPPPPAPTPPPNNIVTCANVTCN